jgi:hypothetical protein
MPTLPLLFLCLPGCDGLEIRSPIVLPDAGGRTEAPVPAAAATPTLPTAEGAAEEWMALIRDLCARDWSPEALRERVAPGAVPAGGRTLPPGLAWWTDNGTVSSVYTTRLHSQVIWWPDPPAGAPVAEVHVVPQLSPVAYRDFVARYGWSAPLRTEQSGPLSDLEHLHSFACEGRTVEVVLHEVVWQNEAVGRLGQFTVRRTAG